MLKEVSFGAPNTYRASPILRHCTRICPAVCSWAVSSFMVNRKGNMNTKISFHHMPHSDALEEHSRNRLAKIETLFKHAKDQPLFMELFLHAQPSHVQHHKAELHVKTNNLNITTHDEGPDMYAVVDTTVNRMVSQIKKEKDKAGDKKHRVMNEKAAFVA